MKTHSGCCGCGLESFGRRTFLAAMGGATVGISAAFAEVARDLGAASAGSAIRPVDWAPAKDLVVQPVLVYRLYERREATSWRPWGGLHTQADVEAEKTRIRSELGKIEKEVDFGMSVLPLEEVSSVSAAESLIKRNADVMLIYAASGDGSEIERLISPDRYNLMFVRHRSGPVYLWYEIAHPRMLRKTVDEYGQPGLRPSDVVVDETEELIWRLRSLFALKNTLGSKILAIGDASGWGAGGREAPKLAVEKWKLEIVPITYEDLAARLDAAKKDPARIERALARSAEYLTLPGTTLETDRGFVDRSFLLTEVFEDLMREAEAPALTVNHCMGTIMPICETTACLSLSVLNDSGVMAFCESDFVVIPSGILLHRICGLPVFLQDPTYPHDGVVTLAHCTAPRKMDGARLEPSQIQTHFESDYGAAPKVDMKVGQTVTVIDPDFEDVKWLGFRGTIVDNPHMDICRSQIDVAIDGDWERLVEEMRGFHWMLSYGDHRKETGYALKKLGIEWVDVSEEKTASRIG